LYPEELISKVLHHIPEMQRLCELLFWPVWITMTIAAAALAARLFRHSLSSPDAPRDVPPKHEFDWSNRTLVPLTLLALFAAGYSAMMLVWDAFVWYDDSLFTLFTLRGVNMPLQIAIDMGRLFPLGGQEFSVIRHFTSTVTGYYSFSIAEVLIFAGIVLALDDELSLAQRALLAALALATPGTVFSFLDLPSAERTVFVLLACLALLIKLFERSHAARWAVGAAVCSQCLLYLKEPVFLLLLAFTTSRLIFRRWNLGATGWRDAGSRLDLFIAALSLVYFMIYGVVMLGHSSAEYLVTSRVSWLQAAGFYLRVDWLAWIFSTVAIVRMYRILRRQAAPQLLWDGLACGGVTYFAVFIALGMAKNYYASPVDLISILYLGRLLFPSWQTMRPRVRVAVVALAIVVMGQALRLSPLQVLDRKRITRGKVAIAGLILDRYRRDPASVRRLYFPYTGTYVLEEFLAYLDYLGLPVEQEGDSSADGKVEIFSAMKARTGKCVRREFICHAGPAEDVNLVVVLPDDNVSSSEWPSYYKAEQKLESYDSRVRSPAWLWRARRLFETR
jgi:hypothetical protein